MELGLFDDDCRDDRIAELEWAALGRCSTVVGAPVRTVAVTDRYDRWSDRLTLSPGLHRPAPALAAKYMDDDGAERTIAPERYLVDTTSRTPAVASTRSPSTRPGTSRRSRCSGVPSSRAMATTTPAKRS